MQTELAPELGCGEILTYIGRTPSFTQSAVEIVVVGLVVEALVAHWASNGRRISR